MKTTVNQRNTYNAKLFFLFCINKSLHFEMCTITLLKRLISPHFSNTIITDSFCAMNTNDQIQT